MSTRSLGRRPRVFPLEAGDHLNREEFERRYSAMPHLKKAELLEGVVYMPSPVRLDSHGEPHSQLGGWLFAYRAFTPGLRSADNATVRLPGDNEPQPDLLLMIPAEHGGQARITDDGYIEGSPEWVAEIAASSASYDLHAKRRVYRDHGVREYVIWRVLDEQIDWLILRDGEYESLMPDTEGVLRSEVFPGLWLDATALIRGELTRVLEVVREGIASPEHAAFLARLTSTT